LRRSEARDHSWRDDVAERSARKVNARRVGFAGHGATEPVVGGLGRDRIGSDGVDGDAENPSGQDSDNVVGEGRGRDAAGVEERFGLAGAHILF
jgi:hypothetical protein